MGEKKEEKRVAPEDLTPEERAYYRETWGFDPVADKKDSPSLPHILYYYDTVIPLDNDSELQAAGVGLHARVEADENGKSHNRIVFRRGGNSAEITCMHTAIYSAPAQEVFNLPGERLEELVTSTEGHSILLPPWEHFAALKSFVNGLAVIGILRLCIPRSTRAENDEMFAVGIDSFLGNEIASALYSLTPEIMQPRRLQLLDEFLDTTSSEWLIKRWEFLDGRYGASKMFEDRAYLASLGNDARLKVFLIFATIWEKEEGNFLWKLGMDILDIILTPDFLKSLQTNALSDLFKRAVDIVLSYEGTHPRHRLRRKINRIFRDLLLRHDAGILDSEFLGRFFLEFPNPLRSEIICFSRLPEEELFLEIGQTYLHRVLDIIFAIWERKNSNESNSFILQIISYFLQSVSNKTEKRSLLEHILILAPQEWLTHFWLNLEKACRIEFICFLNDIGTLDREFKPISEKIYKCRNEALEVYSLYGAKTNSFFVDANEYIRYNAPINNIKLSDRPVVFRFIFHFTQDFEIYWRHADVLAVNATDARRKFEFQYPKLYEESRFYSPRLPPRNEILIENIRSILWEDSDFISVSDLLCLHPAVEDVKIIETKNSNGINSFLAQVFLKNGFRGITSVENITAWINENIPFYKHPESVQILNK